MRSRTFVEIPLCVWNAKSTPDWIEVLTRATRAEAAAASRSALRYVVSNF